MTDLLRANEELPEDVKAQRPSGTILSKMLPKATHLGVGTSDDIIAQLGPHGASTGKNLCNTPSSRFPVAVDSSTSLLQQHFWGSEGKQQSTCASMHFSGSLLRHSTGSRMYENDLGSSGLRFDSRTDLTAFLTNQWTRPNILRQRSDNCFKQLLAFVSRRTPSEPVKLPTIPKTPLVVLTKPRLKVHSDTSDKHDSDDTDPAVEDVSAPRRYSSRQRRAPARLREVQSHQQPDAYNQEDDHYVDLDDVNVKGGDFDTGNSSDDVLSPRYVRPTSRRKSPPLLDDMHQTLHNHHHMMNRPTGSQRRPISKRPRLEKKNEHVSTQGSDLPLNHDDETERAQAANALAMLCARNRGSSLSETNQKPGECNQQ